MSAPRATNALFQIVLETAIERGFGIYGICDLISRMRNKEYINISEYNVLMFEVEKNQPLEITKSGYYWPTGEKHELTRIEFLKNIIKNLSK